MNLKRIMDCPIRFCELSIKYDDVRDGVALGSTKGKECLVRLRKRCGVTEEKIANMQYCPDKSFQI